MSIYKKYGKELIVGLIELVISVILYLISKDENLSLAVGILLAAFSVQAALLKSNVEESLKDNLKLHNLVTSINDPVFKSKAQKIMEQCLIDLKSLASETYEVYGPEPSFLELVEIFKRTQANDLIKSVVVYERDMILDGIFLEHHKDIIKKGATIIKIFIVPDGGQEEYYNKIKAFHEAGIQTYVVQRKTIGPDYRLIADFLIHKNIIAISTPGRNGMLDSLRITVRQSDYDVYTHKFEELSKIANPFSELSNQFLEKKLVNDGSEV